MFFIKKLANFFWIFFYKRIGGGGGVWVGMEDEGTGLKKINVFFCMKNFSFLKNNNLRVVEVGLLTI